MNNEEKILAMLAEIKATQEKQGEALERQGEVLERHDATLSDLQKIVTRVAVTRHDMLLQKLARKERVEALEDDMALLKTVIKAMSQRIENLEKAKSETA